MAAAGESQGPAEELVPVFVVRCPLGDECSKKGGILSKKRSEGEARQRVAWHLMPSPCHGLCEDDTEAWAQSAEVEEWQEEEWR